MAYLPQLQPQQANSLYTTQFGGIRHTEETADGELYSDENLTTDHFPLLATRRQRRVYGGARPAGTPVAALFVGDVLVSVTNDGKVYYGSNEVTGLTVSTVTTPRLVRMGAYVCIFPDCVYFNTADLTDSGSMALTKTVTGTISVQMCRENGSVYLNPDGQGGYQQPVIWASQPDHTVNANIQYYIDASDSSVHVLMQWSAAENAYVQVPTVYNKITIEAGSETFEGFNDYDGVTISDLEYDPVPHGESAGATAQVASMNADRVIYHATDKYLVVAGSILDGIPEFGGDPPTLQNTYPYTSRKVTVSRTIPELQYVVESGNRLWGCRYEDTQGASINEIYASGLGDFKNWHRFIGLSTDSYTVSIGTPGAWTGAGVMDTGPVFFKADRIFRIAGQMPSNFQLVEIKAEGCIPADTVTTIGGSLYYVGRNAVWQYDGTLPVRLSDPLGPHMRFHAWLDDPVIHTTETEWDVYSAGAYNGKYYIDAACPRGPVVDNSNSTWVWDTAKQMWHREQGYATGRFIADSKTLYSVSQSGMIDVPGLGHDNVLLVTDDPMRWSATFGMYGYEAEPQKYISRFNLRMWMEAGGTCKIEMQYDSDGWWHDEGTVRQTVTGTVTIPVIPVRCDHMQLRLSGKGQFKLFSIGRVLETGGDVQWG